MSIFSETVKRLMRDRGVNAKVVCEATGIPQSTFSEWMSGREPKLSEPVVKLARFFGCSIEYLATGREPEQDIVTDMIESLGDGFAMIHRGVYRVKVEKFVGKDGRKSKREDNGND